MTIELSRRGFLGLLGGAAALVVVAPMAKIWVPAEQEIIMPEAFEAARTGNLICGWLMSGIPTSDMGLQTLRESLLGQAFEFPSKVPLMILQHSWTMGHNAYRFNRFFYRGAGDPNVGGNKVKVLASWANAESMVLK